MCQNYVKEKGRTFLFFFELRVIPQDLVVALADL